MTPVGARVTRLVVRQADAGQGTAAARTYMPTRVVPSDRADLALLRIRAPGAPALALAESASIGTPVASVGFGAGSAFAEPARGDLEPAVRRGVIARTGIIDEDEPTARPGMLVTIPLESGDSGAPVVDADGAARGVAVIRTADGGIAERATEVRQLLATVGVEAAPGRSAQLFRGGMAAFWDLDLAAAERGSPPPRAPSPTTRSRGSRRAAPASSRAPTSRSSASGGARASCWRSGRSR